MGAPEGEVESALRILEGVARKGHAPSHYVARHVLLALGGALREGGAGVPEALVDRARAAGGLAGPAWVEAVQAELAFACGEFAQCVDPRYLSLPSYDLPYTLAARERLADRLRAARELGFELAPREQEILRLADRVLEAYREERAGKAKGAGPATGL